MALLLGALCTACIKPTPAGNEAFVHVLERDLRGGQAPPWTHDDALARLNAGMSRRTIATDADMSQDANDRRVQTDYDLVLGHPPSADDETTWLARLANGTRELSLITSLLASDELYTQAGGTDGAWLDRVGELALGHPLDPGDKANLLAALGGGTDRATVAAQLWTRSEAIGRRVDSVYERLLGRAPSSDEMAAASSALATRDDSTLEIAVAAGDEYYGHAATDVDRLVVDTALLRVGTQDHPYTSDLTALGGTPPYSWTVHDAPEWATVSDGSLIGTPTAPTAQTVVLEVSDATGATATRRVPLRIVAPEPASQTVYDATNPAGSWHGILTQDGGDAYWFGFGSGHLAVDAFSSNTDTNLRAAVIPDNAPAVSDGLSCATWSTESSGFIQQGVALEVRVGDAGRIRALTVTKNVIFAATWGFNFHTWDTDRAQPFQKFAGVDLSRALRRVNASPTLPWKMCGRVLDGYLEFKVWLPDQPEPAWGDPLYGGRAPIPDGWDEPGVSGWYIGHLPPGGSATMDDLTTGAYGLSTSGTKARLSARAAEGTSRGTGAVIRDAPGTPPS